MIGATFCSGIGAPEVAAPWVDWVLASEIEPFPCAVLEQRLGYVDAKQAPRRLMGDFTAITLADYPELPNIIVAGTPCQAFSIAGLRKGVDDKRGNLTLKFVEKMHDLVAARSDGKLIILWENVPGVLSDKGNAFGCFLAGLVGADDPLHTPDGKSWPSAGMVAGPRSRAAWRVLDAQYQGLAQRRKRVFLVVDFGNAIDPAKVLFERQGVSGNPAPSREKGAVASALTANGVGTGGGPDDNQAQANHLIAARMTAIGEYSIDGTFSTIKERDYKDATDLVFGLNSRQDPQNDVELVGALDGASPQTQAVTFAQNASGEVRVGSIAGSLGTNSNASGRNTPMVMTSSVRRIMPVECARLQGFPDDWTAITYRNKPAKDAPKYRAYGNSMAVPVIAWIMDRIRSFLI